jgi:hypothetical protein
MSKSTSEKKIAANRLNGKKGKGPNDTRSTRFNAVKHGLLAAGITELDDSDGYREMLRDLTKERKPVGVVDTYLVQSMASKIVRSRRIQRLEAEYVTSILNPPIYERDLSVELAKEFSGTIVDPGLPAPMPSGTVQTLFNLYQRYETANENQFYRALHELERVQRLRLDERVPPPTTPEVTGGDTDNPASVSFAEVAGKSVQASLSESPHKPDDQQLPALGAEASMTADQNIQVDAPGPVSVADPQADQIIQMSESLPPEEEEFKSLMPTEEAEALTAVDLNTDDNAQDSAPVVSSSERDGLDCCVAGGPAESEDLSKGEPETAETNEEDP